MSNNIISISYKRVFLADNSQIVTQNKTIERNNTTTNRKVTKFCGEGVLRKTNTKSIMKNTQYVHV